MRKALVICLLLVPLPLLADYPDDCLGGLQPSADTCPPALTYDGCCDAQGRSVYCQGGQLYCLDCPTLSPSCGWKPGKGYVCGTPGDPDPSFHFLPACDLCASPCSAGQSCVDGTCQPCTPACEGRECGPDGCGGSCGECAATQWCNLAGTCYAPVTVQATQVLECGQTIAADTTSGQNTLDQYACASWDLPGPELAYAFTLDGPDTIRLQLTSPQDTDVRMHLGDTVPAAETCFWANTEVIELSLPGPHTYTVIIDGPGDKAGTFTLQLVCATTCQPDCTAKECGSDGCFAECGQCASYEGCYEATCLANDGCLPWYLKGCGGCPCEACVCSSDSWCCEVAWDELCAQKCEQACGGCLPPEVCGDNLCDPALEDCATCPDDCGCAPPDTCVDGACVCTPDCADKECGYDGCGGLCGECAGLEVCVQGTCICAPTCEDRECGDDGCGGSCGECPADGTCLEGLCLEPTPPDINVPLDTHVDIPEVGPSAEADDAPPKDAGCCAGGNATTGIIGFLVSLLFSLVWRYRKFTFRPRQE